VTVQVEEPATQSGPTSASVTEALGDGPADLERVAAVAS
jgi:hypothetical protein